MRCLQRLAQYLMVVNVVIARLRPADAAALYACVAANREHLANMRWAATATLESVREHLTTTRDAMYGIYTYGELHGCVSLRPLDDGHWLLGYWLGHFLRGSGVVTEAARQLLSAYFAGSTLQHRVVAMTTPVNIPSQRVLAKLGFSQDPYDGGPWYTYGLDILPKRPTRGK